MSDVDPFVEALMRYGYHLSSCAFVESEYDKDCDCGFADIYLAAATRVNGHWGTR